MSNKATSLVAAALGVAVALAGCTVNVGVPTGVPAGQPVNARPADSSPASTRAAAPAESKTAAPVRTQTAARPSTAVQPKASAKNGSAKNDNDPAPKKRIRLGEVDTSPDAGLAWIVEGDRGEGTRCVQHALNVINDARLSVDGYFGPVSRRALESFQRSIAIRDDGEVGPATGHWLATYYDYALGAGSWARTGCYGYVPARRN